MPRTERRTLLRLTAIPLLALTLMTTVPPSPAYADHYDNHRRDGYNDEYIFAATRGVAAMDVSPALKVPLFPLTIVLDLVALPVEAIAGFF